MKLAPVMQLRGVRPEMAPALVIVEAVFARHGLDAVVTSGFREGSKGKHGTGEAIDIRLPSVCEHLRLIPLPHDDLDDVVLLDLRRALAPHYDVVDERKPLTNPPPAIWAPHFHLEYDPHAPARG